MIEINSKEESSENQLVHQLSHLEKKIIESAQEKFDLVSRIN